MTNYERPELSKEEQHQLLLIALKICDLHNRNHRLAYIINLLTENQRLMVEVNEHRQARGFELLPTVDNSKARIA